MQLSENTLSALKNFAAINAGILIKAGAKELKTKSIANNIFAKAEIIEDFPVDVPIYDMNEFLNVVSLFNDPDFDWQEKAVIITDKKNKRTRVKYQYASKDLITFPEKDINLNEFDVNFSMTRDSISSFAKASSMLVVEDVSLTNLEEADVVTLKVLDNKNSASNVFALDVGKTDCAAEFDFHFKAENLKLYPGDYEVGLSSKLISKFTCTTAKIEYYIAIEASSTYNAE